MKYYLTVDKDNYLLSIASVGIGIEADINLDDYDLSGYRINAHKWDGKTLMLDEERLAEIDAGRKNEEEPIINTELINIEQLRADIDYLAIMAEVDL